MVLKLINEILLFQYSCAYISAKMWISSAIDSALEGARLAVYCVQVSRSHLLRGRKKFPLNIETIEFC